MGGLLRFILPGFDLSPGTDNFAWHNIKATDANQKDLQSFHVFGYSVLFVVCNRR